MSKIEVIGKVLVFRRGGTGRADVCVEKGKGEGERDTGEGEAKKNNV